MIVVELAGGRIRVADVRDPGSKAALGTVWSAPFPNELTPAHDETNGLWLKAALKEAGLGRGEAQVLLGRGVVTCKSVRVPVVPEAELPTVVFYALDSSAAPAGDLVTDFQAGPVVPINATESEQDVLTASLPSERLETIRSILTKAGLVPRRITLRPYATRAALGPVRADSPTEAVIYLAEDGAEISLWSGSKLRLCRWMTLTPAQRSAERLANDLRRTLAAFHAEAGDDHVGKILLLGDDANELAPSLQEQLSIPTTASSLSGRESNHWALVGGADLASPCPIDFLKPKRTAPVSNQQRVRVLAGTLLAVLLAGGAYVWFSREAARRDGQIQSLQSQLAQLTQEIKTLKPTSDRHQVIKEWIESGDPVLDELQEVAAQLPDTSDLFLTGLEYNAGQNKQPGTIKLDGLSRDQSVVTRAQTSIAGKAAGRYDIIPRGLDPGADVGPFVWRFGLDLGFDPLSIAEYAERAGARAKTLEALKPPPSMVRQEMSLARASSTAPASPSKSDRKEAKQAAKAEGSATGSDLRKKKIEELKKLPADQREAAIAKEPKFLQKQLRQELKKEGL
jgi:Tfp pilus assembly PilM family ATPase